MLRVVGKVVTLHSFESKKSGREYLRIGVAGGGEYNQFNMPANSEQVFEDGDEVDVKVVLLNGGLWLQKD